jgi:hypothetical protein
MRAGTGATEWGQPDLTLPTGEQIEAWLFQFTPLLWYRLADAQDVSMRLIAEWTAPRVALPVRCRERGSRSPTWRARSDGRSHNFLAHSHHTASISTAARTTRARSQWRRS